MSDTEPLIQYQPYNRIKYSSPTHRTSIKSHYSPPPARMVLPRGFYKMTIENLNGISGKIIITSKSWSIISSPPPPPHLASSIRVWHLNHHLLCFSFKLFQYLMRVCVYACEHSLLFKAPNCLFRNHSPPFIARIEIRTWFPPVFGYKLIWGFVSGCWNPPCGDLVVIKYTSHEHVWHDENPPWCILWRDDDDDSSDRIERKGGGGGSRRSAWRREFMLDKGRDGGGT